MNEERKMIICEACDGEGGFDVDKYHNGLDRHYTRFEECSLCEGSGELVEGSFGELEASEGVVTIEALKGIACNCDANAGHKAFCDISLTEIGLFANGEAVGIRRRQGGADEQ